MHDLHNTLALSCTFKMVHGVLQATDDGPNRGTTPLLEPGTVIDSKFRIVSLLGEGGMGVVYRAHHLSLGNDVALKTFRSPDLSAETWQRFQREAQAIAKLENKNIVRVFDFGISQGNQPYYTLELLEGESLADRLKRKGALPLPEALAIFTAVAEGLVSAHAKGIVHRDLKPANIFLVRQDNKVVSVKLVDFGIAKLMGAGERDAQHLTAAGKIFGSPLYMSPEQSVGEDTDERSDIYSYACALYETLTGRPPFIGENAFATVCMHQNDTPQRLAKSRPGSTFPPWLETLIAMMLAKKREERLQSFQEVLDVFSSNKNRDNQSKVYANTTSSFVHEMTGEELGENGIGNRRPDSVARKKKIPVLIGAISLIALSCAAAYTLKDRLRPNLARPKQDKPTAQSVRPPASPALVEGSKLEKPEKVGRYFQRIESSPQGQVRVFQFPVKTVGMFSTGDKHFDVAADKQAVRQECKGLVKILFYDNWTFQPDTRLLKETYLFDGFRSDDLPNINFNQDINMEDEWKDNHMHAIAHLSGVKRLSIKNCEVDGAAIADLNQLKSLIVLEIGETQITGDDLLKLTSLFQLEELGANRLQRIPEFLKRVNKERLKIKYLQLKGDHLKNEDLAEVAKIESVESLNLDNNHLTGAGIKLLKAMPKLWSLQINGTDIDHGVIDVLGQIKTLKVVGLSSPQFGAADEARLKQLLPNCMVMFKQTDTSGPQDKTNQ